MTPRFLLSCDSSCDCLRTYLDANKVHCVPMTYVADGNPVSRIYEEEREFNQFYDLLKGGLMPTTSQINTYEFTEYFETLLKSTDGDVVHLCLSSGLSAQYAECARAVTQFNARHPERTLYAVDSLTATQGEAYLLKKLIAFRDEGLSAKDAVAAITELSARLHHFIVADDLFHLKRGGRISGVKAAVGTMFKIKPVIVFNNKGKLAIFGKEKGTKNAVSFLIGAVRTYCGGTFPKEIGIVDSGAAPETLKSLSDALTEQYGCTLWYGKVGPIIATHLGVGAFALVFEGAQRLTID